MKLEFRELKVEDLPEIERIIKKTWNFSESGASERDRALIAHCDLLDCLSRSNYASICTQDSKVIAFLLGRIRSLGENDKSKFLERKVKNLREAFKTTEIGVKANQFFNTYEAVNDALIDKSYDSEVVLLAVDERKRKRGIGKKLVDRFLEKAQTLGAKDNLIFSDTTCNYGFYPAIGYKKLNNQKRFVPLWDRDVEFYAFLKEI